MKDRGQSRASDGNGSETVVRPTVHRTTLRQTDAVDSSPDLPRSIVGPAATAIAGVLWFILAVRAPTNTFHFAPIIVAAAWPFVARGSHARTMRQALTTAGAGTGVALGIGLVLWATDRLSGPTLWHSGSALTETVLFAFLGGAAGLIAQLRHTPEPA
jgi:hypothetical protein